MASPIASQPRITGEDEDQTHQTMTLPAVPSLFTESPPLRDELVTESSKVQDATIAECLPHLTLQETTDPSDLNYFGVPRLQRGRHVKFLKGALEGPYPARFVAMDSSRPWILYWALSGLYMLGEDVSRYREGYV
jgi:protein farnesyltransferase subunit beta